MGRPKLPPERAKTARLAIRVHPDLVEELDKISLDVGMLRSALIERACINLVNGYNRDVVINGMGSRVRPGSLDKLRRLSPVVPADEYEEVVEGLLDPLKGPPRRR